MSQKELDSKLLKAAEKGDFDRIWKLVEQGADINSARARDGWTALMESAWKGHLTPELLDTFMNHDADINARNKWGDTVLMWEARNGHLTPELLDAFIEHRTDINARDDDGNTALIWSARRGHLTPKLAHAYAEQFIKLGTPLEEIQKQVLDSKETPTILVPVLIDKLETEPGLVVDFMKKHVGKKLQEWVDDGVEGVNTLVSRLAYRMRHEELMSEGAGMPDLDLF